jgi:hypothetical protein
MKKIAVVAAAVAALAAASAGTAAPTPRQASQRAQIARLTRLNHQLTKRLRNMTILRDRANAALAGSNDQIHNLASENATLQSQNAALQSSLAQRTSERDAALAKVASLQAALATIPTPLAVAVEQVRREVAYSENVLGNLGIAYSHGQVVSQAAMDYVVGHVSAAAYGYMEVNGQSLQSAPDAILGAQAGICGHAALTFAAIVQRFGLNVRSVQFYYGPDGTFNHIADEVSYDGSWHYFDPTYGFYYEQNGIVLSIADARAAADPASLRREDNANFWVTIEDEANVDVDTFQTDPSTVVTIDQQPFTG